MRLKLHINPLNSKARVPLNYDYPLSATVYKILSKASPEYTSRLPVHGYRSPADRLMKLFTFSHLNIPRVNTKNNAVTAQGSLAGKFQVASHIKGAEDGYYGRLKSKKRKLSCPNHVGCDRICTECIK